MKRIVRRVQSLNERAAELTAAAGQLPNRVAELRQAMTATTGELQNLKSGIQINVADLKVEQDDDLGAALAEVAGHAPVLAKAGFLLDGLDVEVSPIQRLIVHLVRFDDVETLEIQALIQQYQQQKTLRAILSAILKARAMVETIDIDGLDYHKLTIGIGPVPTIRLCWRDSATDTTASSPFLNKSSASKSSTGVQTSFFGPPMDLPPSATTGLEKQGELDASVARGPQETIDSAGTFTTQAPPPLPDAADPAPEQASGSQNEEPATWPPPSEPVDPLARFKVMPSLNRPS